MRRLINNINGYFVLINVFVILSMCLCSGIGVSGGKDGLYNRGYRVWI